MRGGAASDARRRLLTACAADATPCWLPEALQMVLAPTYADIRAH